VILETGLKVGVQLLEPVLQFPNPFLHHRIEDGHAVLRAVHVLGQPVDLILKRLELRMLGQEPVPGFDRFSDPFESLFVHLMPVSLGRLGASQVVIGHPRRKTDCRIGVVERKPVTTSDNLL